MIRPLFALMGLTLIATGAVAQPDSQPPLLSGANIPQGIVPPKVVQNETALPYPPLAVRCGLTGQAVLELLIDAQGDVSDAKIVKATGYTVLDEAAIANVKRWHYTPATRDGVAIAARIDTTVEFNLASPAPTCTLLPPKQYSNGLPPGFKAVEPPDSSLRPGEKVLFQDEMVAEKGIQSRPLHVSRRGETIRINYSINPISARMRLVILTDEQNKQELKGTPSGPYALDSVVSGHGSQAVSLQSGDYWLVWILADNTGGRIVSYIAIACESSASSK